MFQQYEFLNQNCVPKLLFEDFLYFEESWIFLNNSTQPVKIGKLQTEVWGHNSKLETHTVETHIYRLRKKINNIFADNNFIKSSKEGYSI